MKEGKLYTVNKWNKNLLWGGGGLREAFAPFISSSATRFDPDQVNFGQDIESPQDIESSKGTVTPQTASAFSNFLGGAAGSLGSLAGNFAGSKIADGYSAGSGVGAVTNAIQSFNTGNPVFDAIKNTAVGTLGGLYNRAFGIKANDANIATIKQNTDTAKSMGQALGSIDNNSSLMSLAGSMATSSGFSAGDLYKNGWLTGRGTRKGLGLIKDENTALSFQNHAFGTAANRADKTQDDAIMSNFAAFGGFLDELPTTGMPAVDYDAVTNYLLTKKQKAENLYAGGGDTSAAQQLAEGWYNGTIGGFVNMGKAAVTAIKKALQKNESPYGSGSFGGAGYTSEWKPSYTPNNTGNFNEAFDEARNAGAEDFKFGDKIYNTIKEANPIREFNNRHVGSGRTEILIRKRKGYGKDYGPLKGKYSLLPIIPYAFGGDMESHGGDYSTGLVHIDAGGSHEENPYEGVQMGVDEQGVPNLVEEGEVVYDDYVYSRRILCDEATKKRFHFPKKKDLSFADAAKRLEKEIEERPNDPISQAGFKAQMEQLAEQQERQKQDMETQRAQEAFEALSPEEQVALMQQAQQQEAMAQQQEAGMEAQMSPEEMAMMAGSGENTTEMQGEVPADAAVAEGAVEQPMMAYGGNLFNIGGLAWIKKHHPEIKNPEAVAKALERHMMSNKGNFYAPDDVDLFGGSDETYKWRFDRAWNDLMPAVRSLGNAEKHFNKWVKAGLDRQTAFSLTYSDSIYNQYRGRNREDKKKEYDAAYSRLVTNAGKAAPKVQAAAAATSTAKPKAKLVNWLDKEGNRFATEQEAKASNAAINKRRQAAQQAAAMQTAAVNQEASAAPAAPAPATASTPKTEVAPAAAKEIKPAQPKPVQPKAAAKATPKASEHRDVTIGEWNDHLSGNRWDTYGLPGLQHYITNALARYNDPNLTDEQRAGIRQDIVNELNGVQQSYYDFIAPTLGKKRQSWSQDIENHQRNYQARTNNAGFIGDNEGVMYDKAEAAIKKPEGFFTGDNFINGWVDGYAGPQTWERHMGASGDALDDIVQQLKGIGVDYSPYNNWTIGEGDAAKQLYRASIIDTPATQAGAEVPGAVSPAVDAASAAGAVAPGATVPAGDGAAQVVTDPQTGEKKIVPIHRNENLRYAGLFGPAVGLGMQLAGIGKPDYSRLDAAVERAGNVHLADYKPIGNYLTYRPMDIFYEQNRMDANARATDRAIRNNGAPIGTKLAGLLANSYNSQIADGDLYRKALEYNDAHRAQVAGFNRGTDQFNAEAYNRTSQFNANALNHRDQVRSQLAMQAANQRLQGDASWYNSIYGNVAGLFKGISDLGRENAEHNRLADLIASGAVPGVNPENAVFTNYVREAACGGKLKKNKKRGLTR